MERYIDVSDPLNFLGLSFVSCLTGVPPASGPNLAAGLYHGVVKGSAIFLLGAVLASITSAVLIRTLLKDLVLRKLANLEPKRVALDAAIDKEGAFQITALLRLSPVMPLAPANILLSLTSVGLVPYTLGTVVGLLPFSVVYAYVGSVGQQAASGSTDTTQLAIQAVGLVATIGLTWKLSKVAQAALDSASGPATRRNSRKATSPTRRVAKTIDAEMAPKGARRKGSSADAAEVVQPPRARAAKGTSTRRRSSPARSSSLTAEL
jgi:uncharacterized membrane protein YdjX (TVP38/TMEM64 family)